MTRRAHRDSVMLSLEPELPRSVFKSYSAASGLARYAVVFTALSASRRSRHTSQQVRDIYTVTVHSVGVDEDSCLWVQERVDRLKGRVLEVPGRSLWPAEFVTSHPPDLSDRASKPLWFAISQFDIISDPA